MKGRGWTIPLLTLVALYCWVVSGLRPFTDPVMVAVLATAATIGLIGAVVSWRSRRSNLRSGEPLWNPARPWVLLFGLLAVLEVTSYLSLPRHDHPTLSAIADDAMGTHVGRAIMFALWLAVGWKLFARRAHA